MLANTCGISTKLDRPSQWTPSPPIWLKVRVASPCSSAMMWQPIPATAVLPSGTLVEVACGQPAQKVGVRASSPSGRATLSGSAGASMAMPTWPRNRTNAAATCTGASSITAGSKVAPCISVFPASGGRESAGRL